MQTFMCIVTIQCWFTYLKAKREPPTLRLKKLRENLSQYKSDIYFLKWKEMHISDLLSRHPYNEDSPNEIIPIAFMLQELGKSKFPDHLLYLKEEVDALPEQDNYIPYQEDDSCSFAQMTNMKISHYYQTCMVQNAQELILCVCVDRRKDNYMIFSTS